MQIEKLEIIDGEEQPFEPIVQLVRVTLESQEEVNALRRARKVLYITDIDGEKFSGDERVIVVQIIDLLYEAMLGGKA